jgi:DNA-binding transcriptional LysR family regulator
MVSIREMVQAELRRPSGRCGALRRWLKSRIIADDGGLRSFMEFNQVRYFLTLAETLNFTRAAETCNVTQPALTRAIQKLEEELGGLLFYRERNLTQLTELGHLMRPLLEQASAAAQSAREQALAFKRRETAPLRLGLDHSVAAAVLTPVLSELSARIDGFELVIQQHSSVEVCRLLLENTIDAGLVVGTDRIPERLNRWPLYDEALVVLCPPSHRFAGLDSVTLGDLAAERVLGRDVGDCAITAAIEPLCASSGLKLAIQHSGTREDHLHEMVKAALGVVIAAERQPVPSGLLARKLAGVPARTVMLAAVSGRQQGAGVSTFLKMMRARDWSDADSEDERILEGPGRGTAGKPAMKSDEAAVGGGR